MAFTSEQLAAVEAALASGTTRVEFNDGRAVWYQKLSDLVALRDQIQADLGITPTVRGRAWKPSTGTGL